MSPPFTRLLAWSAVAGALAACADSAEPNPLDDPAFQDGLRQMSALGAADRVAVAVHFEDVFCSARLDTVSDSGPLRRLYVGGVRVRSAVLGVACTGGVDDTATAIYAQRVKVDCTAGAAAGTARLDPGVATEGVQAPDGPVTGWTVQRGAETLPCGTGSCKKVFWNVGIALADNALSCTVTTHFAGSGDDPSATGLKVVGPVLGGAGTCFDADGDNDCISAGEQSPTVDGFGTCIDTNADGDCNDAGETKVVQSYWHTPTDTIYPVIDIDAQVKDGAGWQDVQYAFASAEVGLDAPWTQVSFCAQLDANATVSTTPLCTSLPP